METLIIVVIGLVIYFLPAICANYLEHRNMVSIGLLNFFLGWTILGWIGAMIWAFSDSSAPLPVHAIAAPSDEDTDDRMPCPICAESIKKEAKKCRHCGYDLVLP